MKQIVLGLKQYTQDFDEKFPGVISAPDTAAVGPYGWADSIQPYLKSTQLYQCPSDEGTGPTDNPKAANYSDYFMNAALSDTSGSNAYAVTPIYDRGGISESQAENSSLTIFIGDGSGTTSQSTSRYRTAGAGTAGVMADGGASPARFNNGTALDGASTVTSGTITPKHLEGTNFAFVDGHVKWYKVNPTGTSVRSQIYNYAVKFATSQNSPTFHVRD